MPFREALHINIVILKMVGAWPVLSGVRKTAYMLCFILFSFIPFIVLPIIRIYTNGNKDLVQLTKDICVPFEVMLIPPKLISLYRNHHKLKEIVEYWDTRGDLLLFWSAKQKLMLETTTKVAIKIYRTFSIFCMFGAVFFITKPLQYKYKTLPLDLWLPFNPFQNNFVYLVMLLYQAFCKYQQ